MIGKVVDLRPREEDPFPLRAPFRAPHSSPVSEGKDAGSTACSINCAYEPWYLEYLTTGKAVMQCTDHKRKMDAGDVYLEESDSLLAPEYCHPQEEKVADFCF